MRLARSGGDEAKRVSHNGTKRLCCDSVAGTTGIGLVDNRSARELAHKDEKRTSFPHELRPLQPAV